jgi:hypothetical protein
MTLEHFCSIYAVLSISPIFAVVMKLLDLDSYHHVSRTLVIADT